MWIEATRPLCLQFPRGAVHLRPGRPVEVSDEEGRKAVDAAQGKVRTVPLPEPVAGPAPAQVTIGATLTWDRAGLILRGRVEHLMTDGGRWALVTLPDGAWSSVNLTVAELVTTGACFACQSTTRWVSIYGAVICAACHPPVDEHLVKEWIA